MGPVGPAGAAKPPSCAAVLSNLSLVAGEPAPVGEHVYLLLADGFNPYGYFGEYVKPGREEWLIVSNVDGLGISVGGKSFREGEDVGDERLTVQSLEYTKASERYLVSSKQGNKIQRQVLINVDRPGKAAHVYHRTSEGRETLSPWALAATYGNLPYPPAADFSRYGFIGVDERGHERLVTVGRTFERFTLDVHRDAKPRSSIFLRVGIDADLRDAVVAGNFARLIERGRFIDVGTEVNFTGPNLSAKLERGWRRVQLSNCRPRTGGQ